jgi:WD40 repeat protein
MARVACVLALLASLAAARPARADDLPPGALARLGDDHFRAGSRIVRLALSPDGKQFVTTRLGEDGIVVVAVWDSATGLPLREERVNEELYRGLAWGPGGAFAAAIRAERSGKGDAATVRPDDFRTWDFSDPKSEPPPVLDVAPSLQLPGLVIAGRKKDGPEYADFHFSSNGGRVAARWKSADGKHAVHVFELKPASTAAKLTQAGNIDLGAEGADEVRLSADGRTVVVFRNLAQGDERVATAWDVATGKPGRPVRVPPAPRLMLTPDAKGLVVFASDREEWGFDLFDFATGERSTLTRWRYTAEQLDDGGPADRGGFAFSPSGRELAVAAGGKTYVLDVIRGKELGQLEGHADTPSAVAFSADGTTIATADTHGLVRLWDANTLRAIHDAPGHRASVSHAELSPDGKRLLTWADDRMVRLWDLATGKELRAFAGAVAPRGSDGARPAFAPDGTALLYSTKQKLVGRDLQTGLETPLPGEMTKLGPRFAVFAPDGRAVLTWSADGDHAAEVWDWPGGKKRFELSAETATARDPGFSTDGVSVFLDPRSPRLWDSQTGKELPPAWRDDRAKGAEPLLSLRQNPRRLLQLPDFGEPRVFEAGTGRHVPHIQAPVATEDVRTYTAWGLALSPRGGQFAVAEPRTDRAALLCEAATGHIRRELRGHRGAVRVLGFTPDGTKFLTAGGDHTVLVWDVRLHSVPLPEAVKKETSATKLWDTLATGNAKGAYLAMARLARDPEAAVKMASMKLKPAAKADSDTDATHVADARAVELLEAIGTDAARALLKELAGGHAGAFRTQEAKRALERNRR